MYQRFHHKGKKFQVLSKFQSQYSIQCHITSKLIETVPQVSSITKVQIVILLFWKHMPILLAIYKTRNTRIGNGMQGTRGMFTRILWNLLEDSGKCSRFSISANAREDFGECSRRFWGMFQKIPGNGIKDSEEWWRRFWGMLLKIPGNVPKDSREYSRGFRRMAKKNPGNFWEDSGKCSIRFRGMLLKIPGNTLEDSGECWRRFQGMLFKIPGNVPEDFGESKFQFILWNLACFFSHFAVKLLQNNRKKAINEQFCYKEIFLTTTYN